MAKKKRTPPDWEAIEREYRAGQLSVAELARQHGISHTAINKKVKAEGWEKDLSSQVRTTIAARLVSSEVSDPNAIETKRDIIDAAAARGVELVRAHRRDIGNARNRTEAIGAQVDRLLEHVSTLTPTDPNFVSKMHSAATANAALTQALARVIPLERQAFNLDAPEQANPAALLSAEQARRMAEEVLRGDET